MLALLQYILNNPYFLGAAGALIGAGALWYKGFAQGKQNELLREQMAALAEQKQITQTEAKNQSIQTQAIKTNETVNSTDAIPELIKLWNDINNQKTPSDKP